MRQGGYTWIELVFTLFIVGILSSISLVTYSNWYQKNQMRMIADELKQAIHFAKIQALASGKTLTLAPIHDHDDWSMGIRLFEDNRLHRFEQGSILIRQWEWSRHGIRVQWNGFESKNYVRFSPDLMERSSSGVFLMSDHSAYTIQLILNRLGRIREA